MSLLRGDGGRLQPLPNIRAASGASRPKPPPLTNRDETFGHGTSKDHQLRNTQ